MRNSNPVPCNCGHHSPSQKIILAADTLISTLLLQVNENIIQNAQQEILVDVIPTTNHLIRHASPRQRINLLFFLLCESCIAAHSDISVKPDVDILCARCRLVKCGGADLSTIINVDVDMVVV
nr:MAG TPA: hypothetical protein [Caudoviricetes sp.]